MTPEIRSVGAVVVAARCVAQGNRLHFSASAQRGEEEEEKEMFYHCIPRDCGCGCGSAAWVPFPGPVATRAAQNASPAASCSFDQSLILGSYVHHEKVLSVLSPAVMLVRLDGGQRWAQVW